MMRTTVGGRQWAVGSRRRAIVAAVFAVGIGASPALSAAAGMVTVPAGEFQFGDEDEVGIQKVSLAEFQIDKTEVTHAQFARWKKGHKVPAGQENHPVGGVTWQEANDYCVAQGGRLPTAAEWEKAARGTDGRYFPWGEDFDSALANTKESNKKGTVAAGSNPQGASPYGVLDMSGNVREWTASWADEHKVYRIVRGGSYFDDEDGNLTVTHRKSIPEDVHDYVGFRCAK